MGFLPLSFLGLESKSSETHCLSCCFWFILYFCCCGVTNLPFFARQWTSTNLGTRKSWLWCSTGYGLLPSSRLLSSRPGPRARLNILSSMPTAWRIVATVWGCCLSSPCSSNARVQQKGPSRWIQRRITRPHIRDTRKAPRALSRVAGGLCRGQKRLRACRRSRKAPGSVLSCRGRSADGNRWSTTPRSSRRRRTLTAAKPLSLRAVPPHNGRTMWKQPQAIRCRQSRANRHRGRQPTRRECNQRRMWQWVFVSQTYSLLLQGRASYPRVTTGWQARSHISGVLKFSSWDGNSNPPAGRQSVATVVQMFV